MQQTRRSVKVITHTVYTKAVIELNTFIDNRLVYAVECLPEKQGTFGFVVYY